MLGPAPGYRGRGNRRGGPRGNYRPRGGSQGSNYRSSRYGGGSYGNPYGGGMPYRPRGRGGHRYDSGGGAYRRGGYSNYNSSSSGGGFRKRNYDDRSTVESRPSKRKYEPRTSKHFRSAEPQNVSFKLKRLVLGSGDPSSHENDETEQRQHNGLFSSFYDMFLLTRVDSHQKTIQINAKRVEGSVFSTTIHPSSIYSINIFTNDLPDESFFEKFNEQLVLQGQLEELEKEKEEKEKSLEELRQKAEKPDDVEEAEEEDPAEELSAVAEKKLELEIKQKELDVLEVNEKIKKARDRLDILNSEIFEEDQNEADEENMMEEEINEDEPAEPEAMEEDEADVVEETAEIEEEAEEEDMEEEAEVEEEEEEEAEAEEAVTEEAVKAMKVAELREFLKGKGKEPKGKKAALLAMALETLEEENAETQDVEVEVAEETEAVEEEEDVVEGDEEEADAEAVDEDEAVEEDEAADAEEQGDEGDGADAEEMVEEAEATETETIDLTGEADDNGKSICRVFIGLKEPLGKVRTTLAGCTEAASKTYCLLLEADLKEGQRFMKVKRFLEGFVDKSYDKSAVNMENWGKRKVSKIASKLLKEAMKRRKLDFEMQECPNDCGEILRAYELEGHQQNECKNRLIACQYCKTELMHCKMAEHKSVCELCDLRCPNNCGKTVPRKDMDLHLETVCGNQKVDCEFKSFGCNIKEKRKNRNRHLGERLSSHLSLVRKSHTSLETKYNKLVDWLKEKHGDDFPELEEPKEVVVID